MAKLFEAPPAFQLPLSKGQDLSVRFVYKPLVVDGFDEPVLDVDGNRQYAEADYPAGATVTLTIDSDTPVSSAATISGSEAAVLVDHLLIDDILRGKWWRLVISYTDGLDRVICNGQTVRADGK